MDQPSLFDQPIAQAPAAVVPHNGTDTSRAAAKSIEPHLGNLQARVLNYLKQCGAGATDEQMQIALDMNASTQRPRRIELARKGLIRKSEEKRKTTSGRLAQVWRAI